MNSHLEKFKKSMQRNNIDAYLIFYNDPHLNEYLPEHWEIIPYLSGFTGSSATLIVTKDLSGLWTDSRYFIQAEKELKNSNIQLFKLGEENTPSIYKFILSKLNNNDILGINSLCSSISQVKNLERKLISEKIQLKDIDLTADIRKNLPPISKNKIFQHPLKYSGKDFKSKLNTLRDIMYKHQITHHVIGSLDDIAWLFNLRGSDISCNPVFYSYALITIDNVILFIDQDKI